MQRAHYLIPHLLRIALVLLALESFAFGQITNVTNNTSVPIPGAGHDYIKMVSETVNPANGSVSLRISVPVRPGRGLTVPFSFDYDSNGLVIPYSIGNGALTWSWTNDLLYTGGWSYPIPEISRAQMQRVSPPGIDPPQTCTYDTGFMFTDPTGGRHALGLAFIEGDDSYCRSLLVLPISDSTNAWPTPDPVYQASLSAANYFPLRVADPDGTTYTWQEGQSGLTIEDRNGNTVVVTEDPYHRGNFSEADALGPTISSSGFGGSGQTYTLSVAGLSDYHVTWSNNPVPASYSVNSQIVGTNTGCSVLGEVTNVSWPVITAIQFPNGQQYSFEYDSTTPGSTTYGLLNKVIYPSGGYVRYEWALSSYQSQTLSDPAVFANVYGQPNTCSAIYDSPAVLNRYVSFDGTNEVLQQNFKYATQWDNNSNIWGSKNTLVTTTVKAMVNGVLSTLGSYTTSYTYGSVNAPIQPYDDLYITAANLIPVETEVDYCNWGAATCSDANSIRTVHKRWIDPYRMLGEQVVDNGTVTSDQWFNYGPGAQMADKYECSSSPTCYNASQGSPPTSYARRTQTQYHNFSATPIYPAEPSIFDRPDSVVTYDGSGSRAAETDYGYDGTAPSSASGLPGHDDTNYSTSYTNRGNATSKTEWSNNPSTPSSTWTYDYDQTGQAVSMTDPCGNASCPDMVGSGHTTQYSYMCSNAYLSQITNALGQAEDFSWDCTKGILLSGTDWNRQTNTTTYTYQDTLNRLTEVDYPDGGKTTYGYGSVCAQPITTTKWMSSSSTYVVNATLDGLCRITETRVTDPESPSAPLTVDTTYNGLGQVWKVSNPYRGTNPNLNTVTTYDALGRVTNVTNPDSTYATTNYTGNSSTVTDAGGKARTLVTDGLGRLTSVTEDPGGLNYPTAYSYNALDDLLTVSQSGQARGFTYDSLSRLLTATNPESGTLTYTYDANSNVATRTDARNLVTSYGYDSLNRVLYKNYPNDASTARACYAYDGSSPMAFGDTAVGAVGHLTSSWSVLHDGTVVAANETYQFDPLGRPQLGKQCTPGTCGVSNNLWQSSYPWQTGYDLMGNPINLWESSVARYTPFDTAGRSSGLWASLNVSPPPLTWTGSGAQSLLNITAHSQFGGLTNATLGNSLSESRTYDTNRGWLTSIQVGSVYSLNIPAPPVGYAGNGNVLTANDSVNGNWNYSPSGSPYDGVNRLKAAVNTTTGQTFSYSFDAWGNMSCTYTQGPGSCLALNYDTRTNRISDSIHQYDNNTSGGPGNMTADGTHGYVYDGENRVICVGVDLSGNCTPTSVYYLYDAQGQRVGKQQYNTLEDYVYDQQGQIASVHDGATTLLRTEFYSPDGRHVATLDGSTLTTASLYWNHSDWLGTERVRTNASGSIIETCTDTPYGMNLTCSPGDTSPLHFTGKQRDYESGLDNFGARYFGGGNSLGRFMTPDPLLNSGRPDDPQTWNKYAYALNNPMKYTDPTGLYVWAQKCADDDSVCQANRQQFRDALTTIRNAANQYKEGSAEREKLDAVLDKYGEEGEKNNVAIKFGEAGGFPAQESTSFFGKTTVTFDMKMLSDSFKNSNSINPNYDPSIGWGEVVAHEGSHMLDRFAFGNPVNRSGALRTETNAFDTQSFVPKATNQYSFWGLWNPSWAAADRETLRQNAVKDQAQKDVDENWGKKK